MDWVTFAAVWGAITGTAAVGFEAWKWIREQKLHRAAEDRFRPRLRATVQAGFYWGVPSIQVNVENQGAREIEYPEVLLVVEPCARRYDLSSSGADRFRFPDRPASIRPGEDFCFDLTEIPADKLPRELMDAIRARVEIVVDGSVVRRLSGAPLIGAIEEYCRRVDAGERGPTP